MVKALAMQSGKTVFDPQAKLLWHGCSIEKWLKTGESPLSLIEISPTGYCNASCPWCFFKDKHTKEKIDAVTMLSFLRQIEAVGVKAINWTGGGEPTIHPDFDAFVSYAHALGLQQGLFTNGYKEIPSQGLFNWVRISLTEKGFDKIVRPHASFGICLNQTTRHTKEEIQDLCTQAKNFGADYFQVRPALIGDYRDQPDLEAPEYLTTHRTKSFKVYVTDYKYQEARKSRHYKQCYGFHVCPALDWNGNLVVCLYRQNESKYIIGNIYKEDFETIIKKFPKSAKVDMQCQNCCKNHEINKSMYNAKNVKDVHSI